MLQPEPYTALKLKPQSSLVVGLLWHSVNSNNFGVGALTISNIEIAKQVLKDLNVTPKFIVIGFFDQREPYVFGDDVEVIPFRGRRLFSNRDGFRNAIRKCDIVLDIGAGDSFSDVFSLKRFMYQFITKWLVVRSKCPLILSPQTIGPFRRKWVVFLAKYILKRCDVVIARDNLSREILRSYGADTNSVEAIDVAFVLPFETDDQPPSGRIKIGINVSGLFYNGGKKIEQIFRFQLNYRSLIEKTIDHFHALPNCEIHLIGHVFASTSLENDQIAITRIGKKYPGVVVAPIFPGPTEAKSYIARMDFFTGARMHACIAAFSSGVPVVPVAYTRKFSGLFGSLGYLQVADCTSESLDEVLAKIVDGFERREELRKLIEDGNKQASARIEIYRKVLSSAFRSIIQPHS